MQFEIWEFEDTYLLLCNLWCRINLSNYVKEFTIFLINAKAILLITARSLEVYENMFYFILLTLFRFMCNINLITRRSHL